MVRKSRARADALLSDRRGIYFAFQGLFMAVLLLLFLYHPQPVEKWIGRFSLLMVSLTGSLVLIRVVASGVIESWWFQMSLFISDAIFASLTLYWTQRNPDFFLLYFVIIFGTALTRKFLHTLIVAALCSLLYFVSVWQLRTGFAGSTEFWLHLLFLWITTSLLALLSRDTQQAQKEEQQRYQGQLIQLESLATLGQVAGEVAHRIKGPLTTIRVNAEVLAHREKTPSHARRELEQILKQVDRCKIILKDLLELGRIEEVDFERIDLREPLRQALISIEPQILEKGLRNISLGRLTRMSVRGDQSLLHEAFFALLQNAVEAVDAKGLIRVEARTLREGSLWGRSGGGHFLVTVQDDGAGIKREDLEKVFRPFYTNKGHAGTGLGLSAALRILQKHDGTIEATSAGKGRGAQFTVKIPAYSS